MAKPPTPSKALAPALARRAARIAASAKAQHAAEANEIIQFVRSRSDDIAGAFWDIGDVLAKLANPKLYGAVGFPSFEALCDDRLGIGVTTARKLIAIATSLPRTDAIRLRQERSAALLELAGIKGVAAVKLLHGKVRVPGTHEPVSLMDLSANALKRITRDERHARTKGKGDLALRTREANALVGRIVKRLAGVPRTEVHATVPRKSGAEALLHVTVPVSEIAKLVRALREARRDAGAPAGSAAQGSTG